MINNQIDLYNNFIINNTFTRVNELPIETYRDMGYHPLISLALNLLTMPVNQLKIEIKCDNIKAKELIEKQIEILRFSLTKSFLKHPLQYGYNAGELIYEKSDIGFIVSELVDVNLDTVQYVVDQEKNFIGIKVSEATDMIPIEKSYFLAWNGTKLKPFGESYIKPAYQHWFASTIVQLAMNRYYERRGMPPVIIRYPSGGEEIDTGGKTVSKNRLNAIALSATINKDSVIVIENSEDSNNNWSIEELQLTEKGDSFVTGIDSYGQAILRSLNIPDRMVTNSDTTGSRADAEAKTNIFYLILGNIIEYFKDNLKKQILDKILFFNFGNQKIEYDLEFETLLTEEKEMLKTILLQMVQTGQAYINPEYVKNALGIDDSGMIQKQSIQTQSQPIEQLIQTTEEKTKLNSIRHLAIDKELEQKKIYNRNAKRALERDDSINKWVEGQFDIAQDVVYKDITKFLIDNATKMYRSGEALVLPDKLQNQLSNYYSGLSTAIFLQGNFETRKYAAQRMKKLAITEINEFDFYNVSPEEAIEWFKGKVPITYDEYIQLSDAAKQRAFSTATSETLYISKTMQSKLEQALKSGVSQSQWTNNMLAICDSMGITAESYYHLNTVFRTNLMSAYTAGQWSDYEDPFIQSVFPALQYFANMDAETRPEHAEMNGYVAKIDDPIWEIWAPPAGYNCRCSVIEVFMDDMPSVKVETGFRQLNGVDVRPDKGFESNPYVDFMSGKIK